MQRKFQEKLNQFTSDRESKKKWLSVVICLCAVVAVGTSYLLINPADTQVGQTYCGYEEHTEHTDECWEKVLICKFAEEGHTHSDECFEERQVCCCGLEETDGHVHTDACYGPGSGPTCSLEETDGHQHGPECYETERVLVCEGADAEHEHTDECYKAERVLACENTDPEHEHTDECYETERVLVCEGADEEHEHTDECYEVRDTLVCQLEECEAHHHGESCNEAERVLICEEDEVPAHHHDESCYTTERVCVCGYEESGPHEHSDECYEIRLVCEKPVHEHTLQCFSNPEADVEDEDEWEQSVERAELTGNWDEDVIAVAQTQLGYEESTRNYKVRKDGVTMNGYTRYGDWAGNRYGDWNAAFSGFCLHFAGVDSDVFPIYDNCAEWAYELSSEEYDMFRAHTVAEATSAAAYVVSDPYLPVPGDLIFIDYDKFDPALAEERLADHVGIVCEYIEAEEGSSARVKAVEGVPGDCVQYVYYDLSDARIMGFAQLPENPDYMATKTAELDNGIVVTVSGRNSSFPFPEEDIRLHAEVMHNSSAEDIANARFEEEGIAPSEMIVLDVSLLHEGVEVEPVGPVTLSFESGWFTPDSIYHVDEENETITDMQAEINADDGIASLETDQLSPFVLTSATNNNNGINANVDFVWDSVNERLNFTITAKQNIQNNMYFNIGCLGSDNSTRLSPDQNFWTAAYQKSNKDYRSVFSGGDGFARCTYGGGAYTPGPDTQFYVWCSTNKTTPTNSDYSMPFTLKQALDDLSPGFSDWVGARGDAVDTIDDLYDSYVEYLDSPAVTVRSDYYAGHLYASAAAVPAGEYSYKWQYRDNDDQWADLGVTDPRFDTTTVSVLGNGRTIRCCIYDPSDDGFLAVSNTLLVDPSASPSKPVIDAVWTPDTDDDPTTHGSVASFGAAMPAGSQKTVTLAYSDDGSSWTNVSSETTSKNFSGDWRIADTGTVNGQSINRRWKMTSDGTATEFTVFDILEACKSGFGEWLLESYVSSYGGDHLPETMDELFAAFDIYYELPTVSISKQFYANHWFANADPSTDGEYHYQWQYKDENNQWQDFGSDTDSFDSSKISALSGGAFIRCGLWNDGQTLFYGFSNELSIDPSDIGARPAIEAIWSSSNHEVSAVASTISFVAGQKTVYLEYSDDGSTWTQIRSLSFDNISNETSATLNDNGTVNGRSLDRQWRMRSRAQNASTDDPYTTFTVFDILEACKGGFNDWLLNSYDEFWDSEDGDFHLPTNQQELYDAFAVYYGLPVATVGLELETVGGEDKITMSCELDHAVTQPHYKWEYYDETNDAWVEITEIGDRASYDITDMTLFNGGKNVRVNVYSGDQLVTVSQVKTVDNQNISSLLDDAIDEINRLLHLSEYTVHYSYKANKDGAAADYILTPDLSIGGFKYENLFYWDNLVKDPRVPVTGDTRAERARSYAEYLARTYLKSGIDAVKDIWERYLFDIYDPLFDTGHYDTENEYATLNSATGEYYDYGDAEDLSFIKDKNNSSYHTTGTLLPTVENLKQFGDAGIDYQYFVSELGKYAEADAAGDANSERKYNIDLVADCQASAPGPVALIFQIQSSWQMFDLTHANAVSGDGHTQVGAVANNNALGTLYDIKNALLRLCDFMEENYPGKNLVLGITETRHDASQTMFYGTKTLKNNTTVPLYVTNNLDTIRAGITGMDSFGNCEHVHYTTTDLVNAVTNLPADLMDWTDFYGNPIYLDDIQKSVIVIGGPTENADGTNGYACELPFADTFSKTYQYTKEGESTQTTAPLLNSVYGIRTNTGTSYVKTGDEAGILSWLDYSKNNTGAPFKDGNGSTNNSNFTKKYVATNEDAILNALIDIVEREAKVKKVDIQAQEKYVEDVTVNDTVTDEFVLDPDKKFVATIWNSEKYGYEEEKGQKMYETEIDWKTGKVKVYKYTAGVAADPVVIQAHLDVVIDENGDRVTTITFDEEQVIRYTVKYSNGESEEYTNYKTNPQELKIVEHIGNGGDGTTDVSYNFGTVYNTKKCELNFGVVARDNYIGSNNVFTNDGNATLDYVHNDVEHGVHQEYVRTGKDTPQVNVPIDYSVVDGGNKKVLVNTPVPIDTDPDLLSETITQQIEDLLDNYDQINGRLNYTWIDSRGEIVKSGGTVPVIKGSVESWPDISYTYTPASPGSEVFTLQVTFTPEDVDLESGNFHDDGVTPVGVNPQVRRGKVSVEAVNDNVTVDYKVVKNWVGTPPADIDSIEFRLTDGNGQYITDSGGVWTLTDDPAQAEVFSITALSNWALTVNGLPATRLTNGEVEAISYEPVETEVQGYNASYTGDVITTTTYQSNAMLCVTLTNNTNASISPDTLKSLQIDFTYNGTKYSKLITLNLGTALAPGESRNIDITNSLGGITLPIPDTTRPDVYPYTINDIYTYQSINNGAFTGLKRIASANVLPVVASSQSTPILRITNTPSTQILTVMKTVVGTTTNVKFPFEAVITNGENFARPAANAGYTLDPGDSAKAYFELGNGEFVELVVPLGAVVTVRETEYDGFHPLIKVNNSGETHGSETEVTVDHPITVEFENTRGYQLPSTGGPGLSIIYALGAVITGIALMFSLKKRRRNERRQE